MMRCFRLGDDYQYQEVSDLESADWLHFENLSEKERMSLETYWDIPKDFILDTMDRFEVPRQEVHQSPNGKTSHLLLVLSPELKKQQETYKEFETLPIAIILTKRQLITISSHTPSFLQSVYENENDPDHAPEKGNEIVLDILWELTRAYVKGIMEIDETIRDMERSIVGTTKNEWFYQLIAVHKNLVYFNTGIRENHTIIQHLIESERFKENYASNNLLHDIKVISRQAGIMVNEATQMIDHLSEVFSSVISHNLNNIMKFLTSLTIVLTIPTIIGSFWGMNVGLPIQDHPFAFFILMTIAILISILTVYWFKKKDYL